MNRLSPRRLVSLVVTLAILAITALVSVLTTAPICGAHCGIVPGHP
jgi:hypothetical protein